MIIKIKFQSITPVQEKVKTHQAEDVEKIRKLMVEWAEENNSRRSVLKNSLTNGHNL